MGKTAWARTLLLPLSMSKCVRHRLDGKTSTSTFDHESLGLLVGVDVAARIVAALTDPVPGS